MGNLSYEFKSTPLLDTYLFAGVPVGNKDALISAQLPEHVTGELGNAAFASLQESYDQHARSLSLSYGKFLKNIEKSQDDIIHAPKEVRVKIADKLTALAQVRIEDKESKFSWIHKVFHVIGQAFRGHGFHTKGEWGLEVAARIRGDRVNLDEIKAELSSGRKPEASLFEKINGLNETQFKELLKSVFTYPSWENICSGLSSEKTNLFIEVLNGRKDHWDLVLKAYHAPAINVADMDEGKNSRDNKVKTRLVNHCQVFLRQMGVVNDAHHLIENITTDQLDQIISYRDKMLRHQRIGVDELLQYLMEGMIASRINSNGTDFEEINNILAMANKRLPQVAKLVCTKPLVLQQEQIDLMASNLTLAQALRKG